MSIRIVVAGAGGRMGGRIIHQIVSSSALSLSGALERDGFDALGADAGAHAGCGDMGVSLTSDTSSLSGDVLVSFAIPEASVAHVRLAAEKGMAAVVGTTGFSDAQRGRSRVLVKMTRLRPGAEYEPWGEVSSRMKKEGGKALLATYISRNRTAPQQKIDALRRTKGAMGEIQARLRATIPPKTPFFNAKA